MSAEQASPGPRRVPQLREPVVLAAFEGWNDAGEAASGALAHLAEVWDASPVVALDPEPYHDFQVNRPVVSFGEDGRRRITWPTTRISWCRPPGSERDVVLVRGIEPSMRWMSYTDEVLGHVHDLGGTMLVTLGALLADVPHTRPIPVSSTTDDADLLRRLALEPSR
ncbi:MAG: PAC2 family protein, partial [Actinomycetota bacterium]